MTQTYALLARLGGVRHLNDPLPEPPKGMHGATYERLYTAILARKREHLRLIAATGPRRAR